MDRGLCALPSLVSQRRMGTAFLYDGRQTGLRIRLDRQHDHENPCRCDGRKRRAEAAAVVRPAGRRSGPHLSTMRSLAVADTSSAGALTRCQRLKPSFPTCRAVASPLPTAPTMLMRYDLIADEIGATAQIKSRPAQAVAHPHRSIGTGSPRDRSKPSPASGTLHMADARERGCAERRRRHWHNFNPIRCEGEGSPAEQS